ncbi:Uncharacterised protein [Klebsiella pneumoniae]|nr:hypothetical protein MS5797_53470 [Klebsiella pneumoniae]SAX12929.1 Uncharacterised protein [Klebsiella pneumoniae]VGD49791.1 Uncharacterised protein [Klebsiella pneumoniae]VTM15897.1 Uncharacterised protein [Klebsiella pneumoniae]VTN31933.1 Uncharacterised protein [Klebsiella pneumoniae]
MRRARHSQRGDYVTMLSQRKREAVKSFLRLFKIKGIPRFSDREQLAIEFVINKSFLI